MLDPTTLDDQALADRIADIRNALHEGDLTEEQLTEYRQHLTELESEQDDRGTDKRFKFISTNTKPI